MTDPHPTTTRADEEEETKLRDSIIQSLEKEDKGDGDHLSSILLGDATAQDLTTKDDGGKQPGKKKRARSHEDEDDSDEDYDPKEESEKKTRWDDEYAGDVGSVSPTTPHNDNHNDNTGAKKRPYKVQMNVEQRWNNFCTQLKAFHQQHGSFQVTGNKPLERWIHRQRSLYHRGQLKPQRLQALQAMGFEFGQPPQHKGDTWITTKPWHERFEQLMEFKAWHGHAKVPTNYEADPTLHRWVWKQRQQYSKGKLTPEQIQCLRSLGLAWIQPKTQSSPNGNKRTKNNGSTNHNGIRENSEEDQKEDDDPKEPDKENQEQHPEGSTTITTAVVEVPIIKSSWDQNFDALVKFKEECGHTNVTTKHDGKLGTWAVRQRKEYRQKTLHPERIQRLESIGFQWKKLPHANVVVRSWKDQWYILKKFQQEHHHANVPVDYHDQKLVQWMQKQRRQKKRGVLDPESINRLDELGFDWDGPMGEDDIKITEIQTKAKKPKPASTLQQLAEAHQKAMARQYEDWMQNQAQGQQQGAALTAQQQQQQQYAMFAQYQQQLLAAGQLPPMDWMTYQQQLYNNAMAGWGWNMRGGMVWCGPGATTTPAATIPIPTPPTVAANTTGAEAPNPVGSPTPPTATPLPAKELWTADDATARIRELEETNAKLLEENLQLRKEKLQLMTENTNLKTTVEETRQAYNKEKKTLEEQVHDHSRQLQEQADQAKKQTDQMQEMKKQLQDMKETIHKGQTGENEIP